MTIQELNKLITKSPNTPGIYRFQDAKHQDIYIGKASSLKKRLTSYTKLTDIRIRRMVSTAHYLVHTETDSDIEALILESQLVKQKRPQFNIMLRDDKQYFYVGFTHSTSSGQATDEFPRIFLTHQPTSASDRILAPRPGEPVPACRQAGRQSPPGGSPSATGFKNRSPVDFVGPFTDGVAIKVTLKYLRNIFPYCTCKQKHHNYCLNYHIGKCLGVCCLRQPDAILNFKFLILKYKQNIKAIQDILNGRKNNLVKELKKQMKVAGKNHDFETAIELQTKIERLERVFYNAQVIKNSEIVKSQNSGLQTLLKTKKPIIRIEGYDISNIQGTHATGAMVTFVNGMPDKNFYRRFKIENSKLKITAANDVAMLADVIARRFRHPEWQFPDLIVIDGGKGQISAARAAISNFQFSISKQIPIIAMVKNDKHKGEKILIMGLKQPIPLSKLSESDRNLLLAIDAEAHRFAISYYRKLHRKSM